MSKNNTLYANAVMAILIVVLVFSVKDSYSGVIFETDFSGDVGTVINKSPYYQSTGLPSGWDWAKVSSGTIEIVDVNGESAAYFNYPKVSDPGGSQPTLSLVKHLTGDTNTGYSELYIRYSVMLPATFKAGDGTPTRNLAYWKFGRLWQNRNPDGSNLGENFLDSGYVVWVWGGNNTYGIDVSAVFQDPYATVAGSSGGELVSINWYPGVANQDWTQYLGQFERIWDIDWTTNPGYLQSYTDGTPQTWHTIEWHIKAATDYDSEDGVFEEWFDGELQNPWHVFDTSLATKEWTGIPNACMGSCYNTLTVMDNLAVWNLDWGLGDVHGGIYIKDVVVSDAPIGHDYVVGGVATPPPPPPSIQFLMTCDPTCVIELVQ